MPSKLKPLVLLGIAGGIVAAVRKRANPDQLQHAASQAASTVSDIADKAKEAVTGNGDEDAGDAPSDEPQATVARAVPTEEPDTSDDPAVAEAESAAAADAGAIGGSTTEEEKP